MKYHEQLKLRKNHISKRNNKNDDASIKEVIDQWFLIFKLALGVGFVVFGVFLFSLFKEYHFFIGSSDISSSSGGFFALMLGGSLMIAFLSAMSLVFGFSILTVFGLFYISLQNKSWKSATVNIKKERWDCIYFALIGVVHYISLAFYIQNNFFRAFVWVMLALCIVIFICLLYKSVKDKKLFLLALLIEFCVWLLLVLYVQNAQNSFLIIFISGLLPLLIIDVINYFRKLENKFLLFDKVFLPQSVVIPSLVFNYLIFSISYVFLGYLYTSLARNTTNGVFTFVIISIMVCSIFVALINGKIKNEHFRVLSIIMIPLAPILFSVFSPGNVTFGIVRAIGSNVIIYNIGDFDDGSFYNAIKIDRKCYEDNSVVLRSNSFMFNFDTDGYYMKPYIESNNKIDLVDLMGTKIIARYNNEESTSELKIKNLVNLSKCDLVQTVKYESQISILKVNEFANIWGRYTKTLNDRYCSLYVENYAAQNNK